MAKKADEGLQTTKGFGGDGVSLFVGDGVWLEPVEEADAFQRAGETDRWVWRGQLLGSSLTGEWVQGEQR